MAIGVTFSRTTLEVVDIYDNCQYHQGYKYTLPNHGLLLSRVCSSLQFICSSQVICLATVLLSILKERGAFVCHSATSTWWGMGDRKERGKGEFVGISNIS